MQHVFGYFKKYHKGQLTINPHFMDWSMYNQELEHSWQELYPNAKEELPPDMLTPKGQLACITSFVDTDHAHDKVT